MLCCAAELGLVFARGINSAVNGPAIGSRGAGPEKLLATGPRTETAGPMNAKRRAARRTPNRNASGGQVVNDLAIGFANEQAVDQLLRCRLKPSTAPKELACRWQRAVRQSPLVTPTLSYTQSAQRLALPTPPMNRAKKRRTAERHSTRASVDWKTKAFRHGCRTPRLRAVLGGRSLSGRAAQHKDNVICCNRRIKRWIVNGNR